MPITNADGTAIVEARDASPTAGPDLFDVEVLVARDPNSVRITSEPELEGEGEELGDDTGSALVDNPDVELERLKERDLGWGDMIGEDAGSQVVDDPDVEGKGDVVEARELREGDEEVGPGQGEDTVESEEPEEDVLEVRDVDVEEELEVGPGQGEDTVESEDPEEFDAEIAGLEARDVSEENDEPFEEGEADSVEVDNPDAGVEILSAEGETQE